MSAIPANDPQLKSWIDVSPESDFPIQNLPFGIFNTAGEKNSLGVAIGEYILDLTALSKLGLLIVEGIDEEVYTSGSLNKLLKKSKKEWRALRNEVSNLLRHDNPFLKEKASLSRLLHLQSGVTMQLPAEIGDYTDFYASKEHATNVGIMFRDPANALLPNWLHLPVAYHGRSSSIITTDVPVYRPYGQLKPNDNEPPIYGPSRQVDFEVELAFLCGQGKPLGMPIQASEAEDYIFGFALFNDWSARDIQKWEYVPLGPFLGKNFASSLSPWVVTMDAVEPFRTSSPEPLQPILPYLQYQGQHSFDINLQMAIANEGFRPFTVCSTNYKYMYWNPVQMMAHHTVNGCNVRAGDLMASGTISGPTPDSYGSMLEIAWKGTKPIIMPDATRRVFLNDDDEIIMTGFAKNNNVRIGFGTLKNKLIKNPMG